MTRTPAAIARWEREKAHSRDLQRQTLELRKNGLSFRQIAEVQGIRPATALKRYRKAIAREVPEELVAEARKLELDRYDTITAMNLSLLSKAYDAGDIESFCKIQDRINAVHDRRKGIIPMAVPTKLLIDQAVTTQTDQDRELTELLGKAADEVAEKVRWLSQEHMG